MGEEGEEEEERKQGRKDRRLEASQASTHTLPMKSPTVVESGCVHLHVFKTCLYLFLA